MVKDKFRVEIEVMRRIRSDKDMDSFETSGKRSFNGVDLKDSTFEK